MRLSLLASEMPGGYGVVSISVFIGFFAGTYTEYWEAVAWGGLITFIGYLLLVVGLAGMLIGARRKAVSGAPVAS